MLIQVKRKDGSTRVMQNFADSFIYPNKNNKKARISPDEIAKFCKELEGRNYLSHTYQY